MASNDDIGERGEAIFKAAIMDFCGRKAPYFRAHFLGAKFASLDYLVELIGAGAKTPYFFAQVKATRLGYTRGTPRRLKAQVARQDVVRMALYPAPTYVIGIDEPQGHVFIVSVRGKMNRAIPSIPATYPLDPGNLKRLWQEVRDYWSGHDMTQTASVFSL
jgi:hypothetical protein